jgi:hypothetical protein
MREGKGQHIGIGWLIRRKNRHLFGFSRVPVGNKGNMMAVIVREALHLKIGTWCAIAGMFLQISQDTRVTPEHIYFESLTGSPFLLFPLSLFIKFPGSRSDIIIFIGLITLTLSTVIASPSIGGLVISLPYSTRIIDAELATATENVRIVNQNADQKVDRTEETLR